MRYGPKDSDVFVYTYKEGLLSAVAHDLELRVTDYWIDWDSTSGRIEAEFDAGSIRVVRTMSGTVSEGDKEKIEKNIVSDVLRTKKFPRIRCVAVKAKEPAFGCELTLCGTTRSIAVQMRAARSGWEAESLLHQPDFGIKPFTAMLGAIKIKPDVRVLVRVPAG